LFDSPFDFKMLALGNFSTHFGKLFNSQKEEEEDDEEEELIIHAPRAAPNVQQQMQRQEPIKSSELDESLTSQMGMGGGSAAQPQGQGQGQNSAEIEAVVRAATYGSVRAVLEQLQVAPAHIMPAPQDGTRRYSRCVCSWLVVVRYGGSKCG
jgi:hypothetical protein